MSHVLSPVAPTSRLRTYASFVRLEHTLFSLPLILAGVFSVPGPALPAARWLLVLFAAVGARTAAMAANRIIDKRLDALNPRTQARELPSGRMNMIEAWSMLLGATAVYLVACAMLGPWFLRVSPIPLAVFAGYPYLKRFTPVCHFGVGLALALAPLAGFAAAHPALDHWQPAVLLAGFAFLWVSGFDIIYATLDEESDRAQGVRSMVTWLGRDGALKVSAALHRVAQLVLLLVALRVMALGDVPAWSLRQVPVALLWIGVAILLQLEQRWAENVNLAFFKINVWVGFGVLALVLVARAVSGGF